MCIEPNQVVFAELDRAASAAPLLPNGDWTRFTRFYFVFEIKPMGTRATVMPVSKMYSE